MIGVAAWALLLGPSPHGDTAQAAAKPKRGTVLPRVDRSQERPITMSVNAVSLEISLGLKDEKPTPWGGEIQVSEGRILGVEIVQGGGPNKNVTGASFKVRSVRRKVMKQERIVRPVLSVTLEAPPAAKVTLETAQGTVRFALSIWPPTAPETSSRVKSR